MRPASSLQTVKTCQRALFSPSTSSVDPVEVVAAMRKDAEAEGVDFRTGVSGESIKK